MKIEIQDQQEKYQQKLNISEKSKEEITETNIT